MKMTWGHHSGRARSFRKWTYGWIFLLLLFPAVLCGGVFAGDQARYQVVAGYDDNGYLVDTQTGAVWILTHRTLPTGREPVAIPYKFIQISPKDVNQFLIESIQEPPPKARAK